MNTFGGSDHFQTEEELDQVVQKCRRIAPSILGGVQEGKSKLCTFDRKCGQDAKIWAIGRWYVFFLI